jgi:hypothetical protein
MQEVEFENYLKVKKIDPQGFKSTMKNRYMEFLTVFSQVSPASFTAQKLFWLNRLRREFPLPARNEDNN